MPTYTIETPGGRRLTIEAADEASALAGARQWHDSQAQTRQTSPAADVVQSFASGAVRGASEVAMLPITAKRAASKGADWLFEKGDETVRAVLGIDPVSAETESERQRAREGNLAARFDSAVFGGQDAARDAIDSVLHEPETTAGDYAETIGEFAPSAIVGPGGFVRKAIGDVAVPAIASETAGQLTEDTALEPWARLAGGLTGNLSTAAVRARADAPRRAVVDAADGLTPAELAAAERLQATANRVGVPLSGPEAVQSVTGGATKLGDLQRVVEGSTVGGAATSRFYAGRPAQVSGAAARAFDAIAPQPANPSTLGPRAAEAAGAAIDDVRGAINRSTRPAYRAAEAQLLDDAAFAPIAGDPAFQASLRRLRADDVLGPVYADMPDKSIATVDAVTKDMLDRGLSLANRANPGFSSEAAAMYGRGATEARDIARTPGRGGSQAYDDALTMQEAARRQSLEPLEQGPLGRVAAAKTTASAADAVLPARPLTGGEDELVDTIVRLAQQDTDLPAALVRQNLADRFDRSAGRLVGGENQYGGARFAKEVAGTAQQQVDLDAVLDALNRPAARSAVDELIDVLQATGMRKPQGSATEFNRQISADLAELPIVGEATAAIRSGGLSIPLAIRDRAQRAWLGRNAGTLAEMFVAPDSVVRIRGAMASGAETPFRDAMRRQALQTPVAARP